MILAGAAPEESSPYPWLTPVLVMVGTIFSGAGLHLVNRWFSRGLEREEINKQLRGEYKDSIEDKKRDISDLKEEAEELRREVRETQQSVNEWRDKYYEELQDKIQILARLKNLEAIYRAHEEALRKKEEDDGNI